MALTNDVFFMANDHAFNVANDEFVLVPLWTSRHGLEEQAAGTQDGHVIDNRIVLDVALGIVVKHTVAPLKHKSTFDRSSAWYLSKRVEPICLSSTW